MRLFADLKLAPENIIFHCSVWACPTLQQIIFKIYILLLLCFYYSIYNPIITYIVLPGFPIFFYNKCMNNNPMHALAILMTEKFITAEPKAAATALASLATHEVILLIGGLKAQTLVAALNPMDPPKAAAVLRRLPLKQACYVLAHLEGTQAAKLWKEFATPYQERLKSVLEPAFVELLQEASGFEPGSVGHVMQTDFVAVRTETKVGELINRLKNLPRKKLPLMCLVTDKSGELKGIIRTAELAFFNQQSLCGSVMSQTRSVLPDMSMSVVMPVFQTEETDILPVTNQEHVLLGIIERSSLPTQTPKKSFWKKLTH